jgi:hypothetical protein
MLIIDIWPGPRKAELFVVTPRPIISSPEEFLYVDWKK